MIEIGVTALGPSLPLSLASSPGVPISLPTRCPGSRGTLHWEPLWQSRRAVPGHWRGWGLARLRPPPAHVVMVSTRKERRASTASSLSVQGSVLGLILAPGVFGGTSRPGVGGALFCSGRGFVAEGFRNAVCIAVQCFSLGQKATFCEPPSSVYRRLQGAPKS